LATRLFSPKVTGISAGIYSDVLHVKALIYDFVVRLGQFGCKPYIEKSINDYLINALGREGIEKELNVLARALHPMLCKDRR
jgi:hypothetical protein